MTIRVLVVEDSVVQRAQIVTALEGDPGLEVVGIAEDVAGAVSAVQRKRPDIVTMDLELPGGHADGLGGTEAIRQIMEGTPTPILVLSAHAPSRGATAAIEALAAGAIDVLDKEMLVDPRGVDALRRRIRLLASVPMVARRRPGAEAPEVARARRRRPVIAIGASTGGPGALRTVIGALRGVPAPILVVQHIHANFVGSFAAWLEEVTLVPVVIPEDGDPARPGVVHVAPADTHLRLHGERCLRLDPHPAAANRPSADELLRSVAEHAGAAGVGVVLTGMGDDGAAGLLALRQAGGRTFAQDGETSTVDGMPRAARERGAVQDVLPIDELGRAVAAVVGLGAAGR